MRSTVRFFTVLAFAVSYLASVATLFAQVDKPRLVLNTGGPTGTVRTIGFSPDSSRLYTAGQDKSVQVWALRANLPQGIEKGHLINTLRWEVARSTRGVVYTMDVAPTNGWIAMAGYSTRNATGDIVLYDPATAEMKAILPKVREGFTGGHLQTVAAVSFSPDGNHLASSSTDGEIRLWSAPAWNSRLLRERFPQGRLKYPQPVAFLNNDEIAAAYSTDGNNWSINVYEVRNPQAQPFSLTQTHAGGVTAIASDPHSDLWATADESGTIYLWEGFNNPRPRVLRRGRPTASIAFAPGGVLFCSTSLDSRRQAVLEMWDVRNARLVDQVQVGTTDNSYCCAVSPDGSHIATYGIDGSAVWVFPLKNDQGQVLPAPLSSQRPLVLSGTGKAIWKVAFPTDGSYRLGFGVRRKIDVQRNDFGEIDGAFDLRENQLLRGENIPRQWRTVQQDAGGWSVSSSADFLNLTLVRGGAARGRITLHKDLQGPMNSYCWLKNSDGQTDAIAVGTEGTNGIFVFQLADSGPCPLLRHYRDHSGLVTSLSVSGDGKYLASGAADQTVKIWSLEGLRAGGIAFRRENAWGAVFANQGGRAVVRSRLDAGIAAHRDLEPGDVITSVEYAENGRVARAVNVNDILRVLANTELWETVVMSVERNGQPAPNNPVLVTPAWEPLVTLFVDSRGEWAMWTPQGFYNASVQGDQLFGWQINVARDKKPDFFTAEQFRRDLERPNLLRRILAAGSLAAAMRQENVQIPPDLNDQVPKLAATLPSLRILSPVDKQQFAQGVPVTIVAEADFPAGRVPNEFAAKAFINGAPAGTAQARVAGQVVTYTWTTPAPDQFNQILVRIEDLAGRRADAPFVSQTVYIEAEPTDDRMTVHVLAMAANKYPNPVAPLNFAVQDAQSFVAKMRERAGSNYRVGKSFELLEKDVFVDSVRTHLDQLRAEMAEVKPSDLLVIFVAGHGTAFDQDYYYVPPHPELKGFEENVIRRVGVPWDLLTELDNIQCRKLYLVDTCRSGNISLAYQKAQMRPLIKSQAMVFAATSPEQDAREDPSSGHGFFTRYLLAGLDGAADGGRGGKGPQNGRVEIRELVEYVTAKVDDDTFGLQVPTPTPLDLFDLADFPLVNVGNGPSGRLQ